MVGLHYNKLFNMHGIKALLLLRLLEMLEIQKLITLLITAK